MKNLNGLRWQAMDSPKSKVQGPPRLGIGAPPGSPKLEKRSRSAGRRPEPAGRGCYPGIRRARAVPRLLCRFTNFRDWSGYAGRKAEFFPAISAFSAFDRLWGKFFIFEVLPHGHPATTCRSRTRCFRTGTGGRAQGRERREFEAQSRKIPICSRLIPLIPAYGETFFMKTGMLVHRSDGVLEGTRDRRSRAFPSGLYRPTWGTLGVTAFPRGHQGTRGTRVLPNRSDAVVRQVTQSDAEVTQVGLKINGLRGLRRLASHGFLRDAMRRSQRRTR